MNHYVFDCKCYYKGDNFLSCERTIFYNMKRMAHMHGLHPISEPFLRPYYECDNIDTGISAVMLLANGGHMTIHTFPRRHCYYVDILTNRDEFEKAKAYLKKFLPYLEDLSNVRELKDNDVEESYDKRKHFGPHLIYNVANSDLSMKDMYYELKHIPEMIGMHAITTPIIVETEDYTDGFVIIAESHISIHYCKREKKAYIDIFSCMPFNYDITDKYVSQLGKVLSKKVYARANKKERSKSYYADN